MMVKKAKRAEEIVQFTSMWNMDGALRAGLAVEKLRELKEGRPVETEIMLPVSLVVRNSTAPRRG